MTVEPLLRLLGTQPAQVLSALLISLLVGLLVSAQAQRLGQDAIPLPGLPAWRWSRLAGALGTWLCALGLLQLAVPGLTGAGAVLELVGRVGLAAASLLLGAWLGQARVVLAEDGDRASREAAEAHRWPALAVARASPSRGRRRRCPCRAPTRRSCPWGRARSGRGRRPRWTGCRAA